MRFSLVLSLHGRRVMYSARTRAIQLLTGIRSGLYRQGAIRLEDAPKHPPVLIRIIPADDDCIGDEKRCM